MSRAGRGAADVHGVPGHRQGAAHGLCGIAFGDGFGQVAGEGGREVEAGRSGLHDQKNTGKACGDSHCCSTR